MVTAGCVQCGLFNFAAAPETSRPRIIRRVTHQRHKILQPTSTPTCISTTAQYPPTAFLTSGCPVNSHA